MFWGRLSNKLSWPEGTRPCETFVWEAKIIELLLLLFHIKVWEQRNNKDVHWEDKNSNRNKDDFKCRQLQSEIRKLQRFKRKARPDDEFLFVHLKTFLKSDTDILLTYFKSHKKAIANSVEQYKKMKKSTGKRSIAGWLRNTAVVHRTIWQSHTRRRKQEEEKERQKEIKKRERKAQHLEDATVAACQNSCTIGINDASHLPRLGHYHRVPRSSVYATLHNHSWRELVLCLFQD